MEVTMKGVTKPAIDRRTFLRNVAVAGGAAAVVTVSGKVAATDAIKHPADSKPREKGYQETTHIRTYYKTARL